MGADCWYASFGATEEVETFAVGELVAGCEAGAAGADVEVASGAAAAGFEEQASGAAAPFANLNLPELSPSQTSDSGISWSLYSYAMTVGPGTLTTLIWSGERFSACLCW